MNGRVEAGRPQRARERSADRHELLTARLLTAGNGAVAAIAALGLATVVVQPNVLALPLPFHGAVLCLYGGAIVVALVALVCSRRAIRLLNGAVAIGYLLLVASAWPVVALTRSEASGQLAWVLTVNAIAVLAAVIAWGQTAGWIVLGALAVFVPLLRFALADTTANAITNDLQALGTAMLLCALAGAALGRARRADAAAAAVREADVRDAESAARRDVEARAQALVHDEVLATLAFAARATTEMLPVLAAQAHRARAALAALATPHTGTVTVSAFRSELQDLARTHGAEFVEEDADEQSAEVPADVAAAMTGAAEQALINAQVHAPESESSLTLTHDGDGFRVAVSDDGPGFDKHDVTPGRLGIAVSILARLRSVGGLAEVHTELGRGVVVDTSWQPKAPTAAIHPPSVGLLPDRDMRLAGGLFAAGHLVLAAYSFVWLRNPLPGLLAGLALAAAFVVVSWRADRARAGVVVCAAVLAIAAVGTMFAGVAVPDTAGTPTFAGMWPLVGASLVLGMLCLRSRPRTALVLLVPVVALAVMAVVPGPYTEIRAAVMRAVVVVVAATALAVSIRRLDRHVERDRAVTLAASTEHAWLAEGTTLAREKTAGWDATIGPLLDRIGEGTPLTDAEIAECLVHEGALRDGYRAGRLDVPAVAAAAARARSRGVDVVLIDDVADRDIDDDVLERLRAWLVGELDRADGSFIARILPEGRSALATASSDTASTRFGG
ncbi:hypothetical protein AB0269_08610 [Microbacterium sp. NPDC077644]|uniref:hypothetical protein n=1 Tax=Microbacterium sp. NPDC077644 TaxID=3155055 RepID=UPI00344FEFDF